MAEIQLVVNGAVANAKKTGPLTAGMVGCNVQYSFDSVWDGLLVTAVFTGSGVTKDILLERKKEGTTSAVPWECMTEPGSVLEVGVEGRDASGNIVIPSTIVLVGTIQRGANPQGDPSTAPTLPVWAQLQAQIDAIETGDVDADQVRDIVDEYLIENPPASSGGEDGATFIPKVSADGTLTWTNDKGIDNPDPVNIQGPQGEKGDTGAQGEQGEKGDKGDTGATGAAGYTPVKGTDYYTAADKTEMVNAVLAALPTWTGGSY